MIGPPLGHPDYNPTFAPYTAYAEVQDTLTFSGTLTAPDNLVNVEILRVTLTAGQTSITSAEVSTAYQQLASAVLGNADVQGNLTVQGTATVIGTMSAAPAAASGDVAVVGDTNSGNIVFSGTVGAAPAAASGQAVTLGQVQSGGVVLEGGIAAGAIHRGQLNTATASGSLALGQNAQGTYTLTGGNFSMWTFSGNAALGIMSSESGLVTFNPAVVLGGSPNQGAGIVGMMNPSMSSGGTGYIQENYVNSSPPYNFGGCFVYVAYDAQGAIIGISAALDPVWAHNGSHSIVPTHRSKAGKPMVYQDMLDGMIFSEAMKDASRRLAYLRGELVKVRGETEITTDYKDLDKETRPHPFGSSSIARVVLMDPDSQPANRITDMLRAGCAQEIVTMIADGDLIFGNKVVKNPRAPSSVQVVKAKLRGAA
ncbi:MAG: hypothetical protein ACYCXT_08125 [Acidiferrobacteraceae bacterium]